MIGAPVVKTWSLRRAALLGTKKLDENDRDAAIDFCLRDGALHPRANGASLRRAEAVAEQIEGGLKGKHARRAALEADPHLREHFRKCPVSAKCVS
jgi:hypothetical protein